MSRPNPSSEWTPEERLQVIAFMTQVGEKIRRPELLQDLIQDIKLLAVTSSDFLEQNRENSLLDTPFWKEQLADQKIDVDNL